MKSKILALSKNEEFKTLLKKKKISNKYVTIFFGHLDNKNNNKLNISFVTKKKIGNAVKRNKIKRRLRNIMNDAIKVVRNKDNIKIYGKSKLDLKGNYHIKNFLKDHRIFMMSCIAALTLGGNWKINDKD